MLISPVSQCFGLRLIYQTVNLKQANGRPRIVCRICGLGMRLRKTVKTRIVIGEMDNSERKAT